MLHNAGHKVALLQQALTAGKQHAESLEAEHQLLLEQRAVSLRTSAEHGSRRKVPRVKSW